MDVVVSQNRLLSGIRRHIMSTLGRDPELVDRAVVFLGLAFSVRDRLVEHWLQTERACFDLLVKRVYYLSMEFLPGQTLDVLFENRPLDDEQVAEIGSQIADALDAVHQAGSSHGTKS